MICPFLLHYYNIIRTLRHSIEKRCEAGLLLCSLRMRMAQHHCNEHEHSTTSYLLRVLKDVHKPNKKKDCRRCCHRLYVL